MKRKPLREGDGGKKTKGSPELILCRDDGRVCLFISVNNGHSDADLRGKIGDTYLLRVSVLMSRQSADVVQEW
jgi:hypothetical protein